MENLTVVPSFKCNCLSNFAQDNFEALSANFIQKLIEMNILNVIRPDSNFINIQYTKTDFGMHLSNLLLKNQNYFDELLNLQKIYHTANSSEMEYIQRDFCCNFIIDLALIVEKDYS